MNELNELCARLTTRRPEIDAELGLIFEQPPSDVAPDAPVVRALDAALRACGETSWRLSASSMS